jgi:peptidoglycan hydrolase-like protein with peptidoglycan-binding domain
MTAAIITRAQWGARPASGAANKISSKPLGVAVHYEGPKMGTYSHSLCAGKVRGIQRFHQVTRGWSDIAYNYLVCPHGYVYEGRGLYVGSAANGTTKANLDYYAVCAILGASDPVPATLMAGLKQAIAQCRKRSGNAVVGHRDLYATACPGQLYARLNELRTIPTRVVTVVSRSVKRVVRVVTKAPLIVDGSFGPATIRQWQKVMGTTQDGVISKPSELVRAVQRRLGVAADGLLGPNTWRAIQRRIGVAADGIPGPITIKALQRRLNTGKF